MRAPRFVVSLALLCSASLASAAATAAHADDLSTGAWRFAKTHRDALGVQHTRAPQTVRGVPVWGRERLVHESARGDITHETNTFAANSTGLDSLDTRPTCSRDEAVLAAKRALVAARVGFAEAALVAEDVELTVLAEDEASPRLAWVMHLRADVPELVRERWFVDASTGLPLRAYDDLQSTRGAGTGALGAARVLEVSAQSGAFALFDTTRVRGGIHTFDALGERNAAASTYVTAPAADAFQDAGVDAHFFAAVVHDYYKSRFGRDGLDGRGGAIRAVVHYGHGVDNAYWDGARLVFGDGGEHFRSLSSAIDVVAHELTHAMTEAESGLVYEGQSGALNESLSDIFAAFVEHAFAPDDANNLRIGELVGIDGPIRDMRDPTACGQPAHMKTYLHTQQDHGGVHVNSGVPNNAMALMTVGGRNRASGVELAQGVGWEKSERIWYRVATELLLQRSDFAAAAAATQQAARDLGYSQHDVDIVTCAWVATGVISGACDASVLGAASVDPRAFAADWARERDDKREATKIPLVTRDEGCAAAPAASTRSAPLTALLAAFAMRRRARYKSYVTPNTGPTNSVKPPTNDSSAK